MVLLIYVTLLAALAGAFLAGLLWPGRRHGAVPGLGLGALLLAMSRYRGDWRLACVFVFFGLMAALLVFGFAADLGFSVRALFIRFGIFSRRPAAAPAFRRPRHKADRDALGFAVLLTCLPVAMWFQNHNAHRLVGNATICLFYAVWWLAAWRRLRPVCLRLRERAANDARRRINRSCPACGYNLTGNISGRCPECGRRIDRRLRRHLTVASPGNVKALDPQSRRTESRLRIVASAMSLLLCMATAGLWISSYRFGLFVTLQPPPHDLTFFVLSSEWGAFEAGPYDAMEDDRPKGSGWSVHAGAPRAEADGNVFHKGYSRPLSRVRNVGPAQGWSDHMSRRAGTFAASLLLLCAAAAIVRESRHPPCWPVTLGSAASFVGKRVELEGYACSNFGRSGRDYAISASERSSPPVLFVRPRPESIGPSGGEHVVVFGVLQNSPEGLLLVEETPAPPSAVFGFAILIAILAATWLGVRFVGYLTRWTARRRVQGLCIVCGYDLRASTGRCPECGATVSRTQDASV